MRVRRKSRNLDTPTLLAHDESVARVKSDQVKGCLAKSNADHVNLHGHLLFSLYTSEEVKTADHASSNPENGVMFEHTKPPRFSSDSRFCLHDETLRETIY